MQIVIRGKKHTFGDVVLSYDFKKFKEHCEGLKIFQQLPIEERKAKIKETYGNISRNVKKDERSESVQDLSGSDNGRDRDNTRHEQKTANGRKDIGREEDKAKVQKQAIRSKEKETKP
jgi:hypothetical protein